MTNLGIARARWAALGAAVAVTLGAVGLGGLNIANADVSSGDRPVFISINPCRLVDTRVATNVGPLSAPIAAATTVAVQAHGSNGECTGPSAIPTDAVGLSLNVTAVRPTSDTFLTFWGEGANPGTSNLNPRAGGAPTPNSVSTPLSATGSFNIYNDRGETDVVVDVNGYYANHNHDDRYFTEAEADARYQRQNTQLIVDGLAWRPLNESSGWTFDIAWQHATSAATECLGADVELPVGSTLTGATLHYTTSSLTDLNVTLSEQPSGPEAATGGPSINLVQFVGDVPIATGDEIGAQTLGVNPAAPATRLGYSQTLRVCSDERLSVGAVRLTYTTL